MSLPRLRECTQIVRKDSVFFYNMKICPLFFCKNVYIRPIIRAKEPFWLSFLLSTAQLLTVNCPMISFVSLERSEQDSFYFSAAQRQGISAQKKTTFNQIVFLELRRAGSNHRPSGYEPDELPLLYSAIFFPIVEIGCKGTTTILYMQHFVRKNYSCP